jgi:transposase
MTSLPDLSQLSHAQKDELIHALWQQVQQLLVTQQRMQEQLQHLQARLGQTSKNSSRPPASDGLGKPAPQSLRVTGQRKSGGQSGHSGTTLRQSSQIDQTVQHPPSGQCSACQRPLPPESLQIAETRQVFELPPLRVQVVAHQQMRATCTCGAVHLGAWPPGVNAPAQYGASIQAMAVHLNQYHLLPLARSAALLNDLYGVSLSQASIHSFAQEAAAMLTPTVAAIGQAVQASPIAHADESGIRVTGKLHWLHCLVTPSLSWLAPHARRGSAAIEALGLLRGFKGTLIHDGLASYKELECTHSLCNAHHLRELVYIHENEGEKHWDSWAQEMMDLLRQALSEVDQAQGPLECLAGAGRGVQCARAAHGYLSRCIFGHRQAGPTQAEQGV